MQPAPDLVLRDIHRVPAPSLWPPAPGWWVVLAVIVMLGFATWWWLRRRRLQWQAITRIFDDAMRDAGDPQARVAAISSLLRRAARRHREDADVLDGEAWLHALDEGAKVPLFESSVGRLMLEDMWRPDIEPHDVDALEAAARVRFLQWMGVR